MISKQARAGASPKSLDLEAKRCSELLTTAASFCHVQSLYITSVLSHPPPCFTLEDCGDLPLETWKYCSRDGSTTQLVTRDDEWQNLVVLIKSLPALYKVTWGCAEPMPLYLKIYQRYLASMSGLSNESCFPQSGSIIERSDSLQSTRVGISNISLHIWCGNALRSHGLAWLGESQQASCDRHGRMSSTKPSTRQFAFRGRLRGSTSRYPSSKRFRKG